MGVGSDMACCAAILSVLEQPRSTSEEVALLAIAILHPDYGHGIGPLDS